MKKILLELAEKEIKKEMEKLGYIDDSDNTDRFLDELIRDIAEDEELASALLKEVLEEIIIDKIMTKYKQEGTISESGRYTGCYYKDKKGLEAWNEIINRNERIWEDKQTTKYF